MLFVPLLLIAKMAVAQTNTWVLAGNSSVTPRFDALGFSIADKGYMLFGLTDEGDTLTSLLRYDPVLESWSSRASFPGAKRTGAVTLSIGNTAYVGLGSNTTGTLNDIWAYDPTSNTWTQRASLPAAPRTRASAFTIAPLGYVVAGFDGAGQPLNDLWAYDPVADAWTARAPLTGAARADAASFVIDGMGYLALGRSSEYPFTDMWRYDPVTNGWTERTGLDIFGWNSSAISFAAGGHGFVSDMGHFPEYGGTWYPNQLWEYDPVLDSWSLRKFFPGLPRENISTFTIDARTYIAAGSHFDPTHYDEDEGILVDNVRYALNETWSFDPRDCSGAFHGTTLPGTTCNDGNAATFTDALIYDCTCVGSSTPQPISHPDELDAGFQTGTGFNGTVRAIAVQTDGKIIASGDFTSFNGTPNNGIARLNSDGSLDTGFNGAFGGRALAIQSNGRILVGGAGIHRLMTDGSEDPSYNTFNTPLGMQTVNALVVRPNGRIVAGGDFFSEDEGGAGYWAHFVQLLPDGSRDMAFYAEQLQYTVLAMVLRQDGRILFSQSREGDGAQNLHLVEENGMWVDPYISGFDLDNPVRALALRPDGGFIAGGDFVRYHNDHWVNNGRAMHHIASFVEDQLTADIDPVFDPAASTDGNVYAVTVGTSGQIIAGGDFSNYRNAPHSGIVQVNKFGYADAAFQSGSGFNNGVRCFAWGSDGGLLVGGLFTSYNGTPCGRITRLRTPGPICLPPQLTTTANPVVSCGAVNLKLNGTSTIAATEVPGANKYQFRFTNIPGQPAYARNIAWPTRSFTLTKWSTNPLKAGRTYNVVVRASFDEGATWCDYGPSCPVKVSWTPLVPGLEPRDMDAAGQLVAELLIYPNPTNGENLRLSLVGIDPELATVGLDITDLLGKRVMSATLPMNEGELDTGLSLSGDLPNGVYIVHITAGNALVFGRFTLAR